MMNKSDEIEVIGLFSAKMVGAKESTEISRKTVVIIHNIFNLLSSSLYR